MQIVRSPGKRVALGCRPAGSLLYALEAPDRALQSDCVKITISKENYLKAIAEAESEGETVIAATLTRWLGVSAPAVTMAIKRLKRDGLIRMGKEGQITLSPMGHEIAERLLHRH